MATKYVTLNITDDGQTKSLDWLSISGDILPDDYVIFRLETTDNYIGLGSVTISGFPSHIFTNTTSFTLAPDATYTKRVRPTGTWPASGSFVAAKFGFPGASLNYTVKDPVDTVPDPFNLGPSELFADINTGYRPKRIRVSGITAPTLATVSGVGASMLINNSPTAHTSVYVSDKDYVQVVLVSAPTYSTTRTTTLNIGGVTGTYSAKTYAGPSAGVKIPWPHGTSNYTLSQIANFFVGNLTGYDRLSQFVRGGSAVPNIPENVAISNGVNLRMSQFANCYHSLAIIKPPIPQYAYLDTMSGAKSQYFQWIFGGTTPPDPRVGYGDISRSLQYRHVLSNVVGSPVLASQALPGTWHAGNYFFNITASAPAASESTHSGTITTYIRHVGAPTIVLTMSVNFAIEFFGP